MGRQKKGFVHIQRGDQLSCQQVAAGIAGNHQAKQTLTVEALLTKQGCKTVDAGGEVGGKGVIIVGAEHHQRVAAAYGGINLLHHRAAVKAASLLAEMQASSIAAAVAVRDGAIA